MSTKIIFLWVIAVILVTTIATSLSFFYAQTRRARRVEKQNSYAKNRSRRKDKTS